MHELRGDGIVEWLADACGRFSGCTALEHRGAGITYRELEQRSGRLAGRLRQDSRGAGAIVALLLACPLDMACALTAVLRAGQVFVPLDPQWPLERLRTVVAELSPDVLLIDQENAELAAGLKCNGSILNIADGVRDPGLAHPWSPVEPDALRYICYTSGSTGRPKGIAGRLKGLSHFIKWQIETFDLGPGCRVSQFALPVFDPYFRDVLLPLCCGGTVCIPPERPALLDSAALVQWIGEAEINLIHCVPSLFAALLSNGLQESHFRKLKHVFLAGEALPAPLVKRWREVFGARIALVNLYGPTESTMVKFFHVIQDADLQRGIIPIGKPMRGARAVLLDEERRVCAPGVAGEIYIRSPFLSLGYFKDSESTRQAFVQNPLSDQTGDIVYKTGDLARVLEDGTYQFLGRKDGQIKIRGVRVEPGEAEAHLQDCPLVKAAAVVARQDALGSPRMAAFVVPREHPLDEKVLRAFLGARLPEHAIPSIFMEVDALPLTPNGKVDRRALPEVRFEAQTAYAPPRTPIEEAMAEIWSDLLGREPVGVNDNFFDLGGHSLLATQVISRLRRRFEVELPVRALFEWPTVAGLALEVVRRQAEQSGDGEVARILDELEGAAVEENMGSRGGQP